MGRIHFSSLYLGWLLDWTTFTGMFPATCSGSQLRFLQEFSKEVQVSQWYSRVAQSVWSSPMVWPCSSYLYSWYVEFMGRKMYAYLGYLYCLAEGWSKTESVLSQIQVSWNMGYLEGMKWMEWMASHLNLFELHNLQLGMESGLLFFFSLLFFKEDNSTLLCRCILNSLEFWMGNFVEWTVVYEMVIAGEHSWQKWTSIPGVGDWQASYVWGSKWWVLVGWRPVDDKYHSRSGCTIRQSSK